MKKTVLMSVAAVAFASSAQAGSLSADFRVDYDSTNYSNDTSSDIPSLQGNSKFRLQTGRLDYKGQLNEDVTYRVRLRFDKPKNPSVQSRDNVDSAIDYAYVANKFSDTFTLTMGKLASEMGGFEGNTAGPELYMTSSSYAGTGVLGGSAVGANSAKLGGILLYYTGVQAGFTFAETQQLHLQVANEEGNVGLGYGATNGDDISGPNGNTFAQTKTMTGLIYRGGFMEKAFNVIASYHMEEAGNKDNKVGLGAVGLEYHMDAFTAQLDYLMNSFQRTGATVQPKQTLNTAVLLLKYKMDNLTPQLKASMSDEKLDAGSFTGQTADLKNKYMEYGLALEYTPQNDQMFRYHVAYNMRQMTPDSGLVLSKDRSSSQLIVGTRIMADFLK